MLILENLFNNSPISSVQLRAIMLTAPSRYKSYKIKKRSKGSRLISQPAKEVKFLQRLVVGILREHLPVHRSATAYEPGASILKNAKVHVHNRFLMKIDFKDFFPSITENDISNLLLYHLKDIKDDELKMIVRLLVFDDEKKRNKPLVLAAGAPSSPFISNALMCEFDKKVSEYCIKNKVAYTRYADDMSFSTNEQNKLKDIYAFVKEIISNINSPRLNINNDKTVFTSKKFNRRVTGLVLTSENKVSIGRAAKREIRSGVHRFLNDQLTTEQISTLRGRLSFIASVEPTFISSLRRYYGNETIDNICK